LATCATGVKNGEQLIELLDHGRLFFGARRAGKQLASSASGSVATPSVQKERRDLTEDRDIAQEMLHVDAGGLVDSVEGLQELELHLKAALQR
jgi:hypothetical protein